MRRLASTTHPTPRDSRKERCLTLLADWRSIHRHNQVQALDLGSSPAAMQLLDTSDDSDQTQCKLREVACAKNSSGLVGLNPLLPKMIRWSKGGEWAEENLLLLHQTTTTAPLPVPATTLFPEQNEKVGLCHPPNSEGLPKREMLDTPR